MKEAQNAPDAIQEGESHEKPRKMGVLGKIFAAAAFILFFLIVGGAIMRKFGE